MTHFLETIDDDVKLCEMHIQYWLAMANTSGHKTLKISKGFSGPESTNDEKEFHCIEIAKRHITRMADLIEKKRNILYKEEELYKEATGRANFEKCDPKPKKIDSEYIFKKEVYEIVEEAIEVHKTLGHGF